MQKITGDIPTNSPTTQCIKCSNLNNVIAGCILLQNSPFMLERKGYTTKYQFNKVTQIQVNLVNW